MMLLSVKLYDSLLGQCMFMVTVIVELFTNEWIFNFVILGVGQKWHVRKVFEAFSEHFDQDLLDKPKAIIEDLCVLWVLMSSTL